MDDSPGITRRILLRRALSLAGATVGTLAFGDTVWVLLRGSPVHSIGVAAALAPTLDDFANNVISGGPPKDGIPPIEQPKFVSVPEADKFLQPADVIFGVDYKGEVKAYPQIILVWHEIVNETFDGEKASVTYCPLTGSAVGFKGRSPLDGKPLTLGTSGKLVNSNLLMYDRLTDSTWPQILGTAIQGPSKGAVLDEFPVVWTTWERWKRTHPKTVVLSRETGHLRAYGRDPYGSYRRPGNNYYFTGGPFFPIMHRSDRLPMKQVVMGVRHKGAALAIPKDAMRRATVASTALGGEPIVAFYDGTLDTVRVYSRRLEGRVLQFERRLEAIIDSQTGSTWSPRGRAFKGKLRDAQLPWINTFDVMWFAWYAFYPGTELFTP